MKQLGGTKWKEVISCSRCEPRLFNGHEKRWGFFFEKKKRRDNRRNHMGKKNFFHLLGIEFFSNPQTLYKIRP